jgi:tetratricopeptide (TPR) repeat protein
MSLTRLFVAVLLAGLVTPAWSQDWKAGTGRLEGRVLDASGQPIEGAAVKLDLPGRGGTTLKTDKKGKWAILGVVAGNWELDVSAPGFTTRKLTVPLPAENARLPLIEVKLEKAQAQGPPPEIVDALKKADEAFDAGRFPEARIEYEKALADPKVAAQPSAVKTLHLRIARCLSQEQQYEKELEHLQAVLDADASDPTITTIMAQEAMKGGMNDRAMALLGKVDESTVKDPAVFFNLAVMFLNQQKPDDAIKYFTKSVTVDPSFVDGYFQRGLAYLSQQKNAEARADFQKVLELQPTGPQAETAKKALEQIK